VTRAMGKGGGEVGVRPEGLFCLLALTAGASEKNFRGKVDRRVYCVCVCVLFNVCGSCARPKAGTRRSPERTIRRAERNCLPQYYRTIPRTVV